MRIILRPAMCGQSVKKKYLTDCPHSCMITQVKKMERIVEQTLLYDFYGELLTDNQKEIYEQFILEDLSLGEIAKERGISRQGVHDTIRRCEKTLEGYEEKLSLIQKFLAIKEKVHQIDRLLDTWQEKEKETLIHEIRQISDEIIEEL